MWGWRMLAAFGLAMVAAAVPASGQEILPGSPRAALAAELLAREKDEWRAYQAKDRAALIAATPEDFAGLYSDGHVVDRKRWLDDMEKVDVERYALSGFHAFALSDDSILFAYRGEAWGRARESRQALHNVAAVTSVWAKRGGRWLNVFYGEAALTADSVSHVGTQTRH